MPYHNTLSASIPWKTGGAKVKMEGRWKGGGGTNLNKNPAPPPQNSGISRNERSKGIDNCCGLYIRVYFRITSIENEWLFINLIVT